MPQSDSPAVSARAAHAEMVAQLRRSTGASELIETHLSSLLIAGEQVYKLKKPVRFGFVDFSTLDARRAACEQELRLNRRTAPHWYLGLLAVRQGARGACLAAPDDEAAGPLLDWAVRMRRFDDRQRLDHLAQSGLLNAAMVDRLAETVARFHRSLLPAPPDQDGDQNTRRWARENLVELAELVEGPAAAEVTALQRWTEARGAELSALMQARRRSGCVREVHGDLHLGNIFWADGEPVLFDALEFNQALRHTDTIGDLAFSFMDLYAHGLPRLAWRFIGAALEACGDQEALPLLAWWAVYRAAVRAKVVLLGAAGSTDAVAQALSRRYLDVALNLAGLAGAQARPQLVLMFGLSGAGKSRVAGLMAERLAAGVVGWGGALRLRSDVERKRLFALAPTARVAPGLYSEASNRRTYDRLQQLAGVALEAGVSVVVDAASLRRSERDAMRALAARHQVCFTLLVCDAPMSVLQARVGQRLRIGADASDATLDVLAWQQRIAEWPGADEADDCSRLDTDVPEPELIARVEALPLDADLSS
jgi:aminoglycoside phosphotransferase family enzyme/predicted kinase